MEVGWGREGKQGDWGGLCSQVQVGDKGCLDSHCSSRKRDKWRNVHDIWGEYGKDLPGNLLCGVGVRKKIRNQT